MKVKMNKYLLYHILNSCAQLCQEFVQSITYNIISETSKALANLVLFSIGIKFRVRYNALSLFLGILYC